MRNWYYAQGSQQCGPITESEIMTLFETGQLHPDSMVWTEGMKEWVAAREVDGLIPSTLKPLPPSLPSVASAPSDTEENVPSGEQKRPWVRYWARMVDFFLFCFLTGVVLAFVYLPALEMNEMLFNIILLFLFVFVESAMLAISGTTPGKALLNIRLRHRDGRRLSYADALKREFKVWYRGAGGGIPIVALITQLNAYSRLTSQGITSWDEDGGFKLTHRKVGVWRTLAVVLIMLGMVFLVIIGNAEL